MKHNYGIIIYSLYEQRENVCILTRIFFSYMHFNCPNARKQECLMRVSNYKCSYLEEKGLLMLECVTDNNHTVHIICSY